MADATSREILAMLRRKMSFGDALVARCVETHAPQADAFASWNARHFHSHLAVPAMTPADWLADLDETSA